MNLTCLFASLALSASPAISAVNASPSPVDGETAHSYRERPKKAPEWGLDYFTQNVVSYDDIPYEAVWDDYKIVPVVDGRVTNNLVGSQGHRTFVFGHATPIPKGYYDIVISAQVDDVSIYFGDGSLLYPQAFDCSYYSPSDPTYNSTIYYPGVDDLLVVADGHDDYSFTCKLVPHVKEFSGIMPTHFIPGGPNGLWDDEQGGWENSDTWNNPDEYGSYLYQVEIGKPLYVSGSHVAVVGIDRIGKVSETSPLIKVEGLTFYAYAQRNIVIPTKPYLLIQPTFSDIPGYFTIAVNAGGDGGVASLDLPEHFMPFELWSNNCDYVNGLVQVDSLNVALPGLVLTGFDFACNGRYYNAMQISLMYVWGNKVYDGNQIIDWPANKTGFYCMGDVAYRLYDGSNNIVYEDSYLCMAGYTIVPDSQTTAVVPSKVNWINDSWRHITILEDRESVTDRFRYRFDNLTDLELLRYIVGGDLRPNTSNLLGLGNVYNILGVAFDGVLPILSVDILPGISIGLLLFLPLIGLIIVVIIKVVHK